VNVLLVRTSALGDIVHALPVLTALRRHLPGARLAWVVDEAFAPLLAGHPDLDQLLVAPLRRARRRGGRLAGARDVARFLARLRGFRADVALDLMGNHKGALIARLSGARRRIGLARELRREGSSALWINAPVAARVEHAVDRGLALAAALGVPPAAPDFGAGRLAAARGGEAPAGRYAFVHPGAAWGNKRYPPAAWGAVARGLAERSGLAVQVGAAPGEEGLADAVVAASGGAAARFDAPSLGALCAALAGARVVLAGDTGALHLARAFGRPLVGVYGPTDPARHGPWGATEWTVAKRLPCSYCHRRMDEAKACLLAVEPAEIVERALAALAAGGRD
jgi:heptosyltransferase-1